MEEKIERTSHMIMHVHFEKVGAHYFPTDFFAKNLVEHGITGLEQPGQLTEEEFQQTKTTKWLAVHLKD